VKEKLYIDEEGRGHSDGRKKPLLDLHWELRAVVLWFLRTTILVGAAYQLHRATLG